MYKVFTNTTTSKRKLQEYDPTPSNAENFNAVAIKKIESNSKLEAYESLFIYSEQHKTQLEKTGSLAGIENLSTDRIVWDFDKKENPQIALSDARSLVNDLIKQQVNPLAIRIYFSGNKGYHVEVKFNEYITQPEFKILQHNLAAHLPSYDTSINDCARIFRYPFSYNKNGQKYKIPIDLNSFLDENLDHDDYANGEDAEMGIASQDCLKTYNDYITIDIPETLKPLMVMREKEKLGKDPVPKVSDEDQPDMSNRPKHLSPAKFALMIR